MLNTTEIDKGCTFIVYNPRTLGWFSYWLTMRNSFIKSLYVTRRRPPSLYTPVTKGSGPSLELDLYVRYGVLVDWNKDGGGSYEWGVEGVKTNPK